MTPTPKSGRAADQNGQLIQQLIAMINPGLRLSTKQNSHFDGRIDGKLIEIKACEKEQQHSDQKRSGRFTLKKKQHEYLISADADYIFAVHDNFELVFYLRVPASSVPYQSECKQKTITWHTIPKLIAGG